MQPLVSVNLCCYNGERYLCEALDSVIAQSYAHWELVVINDGSCDNTAAIIQKYRAAGTRIVYHSQENQGLGRSRNTALELSSGDFIAFIDQDDRWRPNKLERQLRAFEDPQVGLAYSDVAFVTGRNVLTRSFRGRQRLPSGSAFHELLVDWPIALVGAMLRRRALDDLRGGLFDPRFHLIEEKDVFLRLAAGWQIAPVMEVLADWRVHPESGTHKRFRRFAEENSMLLEKLDAEYPDLMRAHACAVDAARNKVIFQRGIGLLLEGDPRGARAHLSAVRRARAKYRIAHLATYLPTATMGLAERMYWRFLYGRV